MPIVYMVEWRTMTSRVVGVKVERKMPVTSLQNSSQRSQMTSGDCCARHLDLQSELLPTVFRAQEGGR